MNTLIPGIKKLKMSDIKGIRIKHTITFNPNKANLEKKIYVDIRKLKPDVCLVPDSLNLKFDFKNKK